MTTRLQPEPHLDANQITAFAEGSLSASERALCLQHLAECARCREIAFLAGASLPSEESISVTVHSLPRFRWLGFWPVLSLGAATLAAVAISVVLVHHTHRSVTPTTIQIATGSSAPPRPLAATAERQNELASAEPRLQAVPKPSPAQGATPKPQMPIVQNQLNDAAGLDSIAAPARPTAGAAPHQLAEGGSTLHGVSNAPVSHQLALSSQTQTAGVAKAAPDVTLRAYDEATLHSLAGSAQISGVITDSSGATIPHAKITLDQTAGTTHRETLTDATGRFTLGFLQPGKYRLEISSPGFMAQVREVDLGASQLAHADSKLAVGSASETVTVTAAAPTLNTESASVQSILPNKKPLQTSVSSGTRSLALDATGTLFLSKNAGRHWKAIHGPWKKAPVTNLSTAPDHSFKVTTAQGSWLSADGEHWRPAN